jgi:uncharacterized protein DUF2188
MANLPRYTLKHDQDKEKWVLKKDATQRTVRSFETKDDATRRGVLKKAIGNEGGSIRIEKQKGGFQEERTFPRGRDPRKSKG